jgi:hypothetical protein
LLELITGVTRPVTRHRLTVTTENVAPEDLTDIQVFEVFDYVEPANDNNEQAEKVDNQTADMTRFEEQKDSFTGNQEAQPSFSKQLFEPDFSTAGNVGIANMVPPVKQKKRVTFKEEDDQS